MKKILSDYEGFSQRIKWRTITQMRMKKISLIGSLEKAVEEILFFELGSALNYRFSKN